MNHRDTLPFASANPLDFEVLDALLTHVPGLWSACAEPTTTVGEAWDTLCALGVGGLMVPTEQGGQGASLSRALSVAWALSRIPAPVPFLSTAVVAPLFATALGERALLTEIATGDTVVAMAAGLRTGDEGEWGTTLHGEAVDVLHGRDADRWLVVARTTGGKASLVLADRPSSMTVDHPAADPTRPTVRAKFDGVPVRRLAESVTPLVTEVVRRAHLVRCVEVLAAASVVGAEDPELTAASAGALAAVRSAAAATDLHGRCDRGQVELACGRTGSAADLVRERYPHGGRRVGVRAELCVHRATGGWRWLPKLD